MTALTIFLLVTAVGFALFGVATVLTTVRHPNSTARSHRPPRRTTPRVGHLFHGDDDRDADARRIGRDVDAIHSRFEQQPVWSSSGAFGERR